jgi:hypothetical protein
VHAELSTHRISGTGRTGNKGEAHVETCPDKLFHSAPFFRRDHLRGMENFCVEGGPHNIIYPLPIPEFLLIYWFQHPLAGFYIPFYCWRLNSNFTSSPAGNFSFFRTSLIAFVWASIAYSLLPARNATWQYHYNGHVHAPGIVIYLRLAGIGSRFV